jgi:heptosyltransferase II
MMIDQTSVKKILVIATKFLGDLVISAPGIGALRKKFPSAKITLLVRNEYENVLVNNPNINRIISFDFGIRDEGFFKRFVEEISFWKKIRKEKFDTVISLQPGDRIAFLAWISGAKYRVAPRKQSFSFLFNLLVDVEEDSIGYLEYYNNIISAFIQGPINSKPEFFLSVENINWAEEFLRLNSFSKQEMIIAIHPGASEPTKIWPSKNYSELIKEILKIDKTKALIIEGPKEEKIIEEILSEIGNGKVVVYKSEDINKTAALLKRSKLLIANDTGTRHLSVALGTPVIALMPIDNKKCWNFYSKQDEHYAIFGKRFIPTLESNQNPFLDSISVDVVLNKIKEILR